MIFLHDLSLAKPFPSVKTLADGDFRQVFRLSTQHSKMLRWPAVCWKPLAQQTTFVLNVDGASKSGGMLAGGGGIIRTSTGDLVVAFSSFYGQARSLEAEARAMLDGMQLAYTLSLPALQIQCDSLLLVNGLCLSHTLPWQLYYPLQLIQDFMASTGWSIHHVYREANRTADVLATVACSHSVVPQVIYSTFAELPLRARWELRSDQAGFPHLRSLA